MPIYDQTYRRYEARQPPRSIRFWPITREALRLLLAKRVFLALLALCWIPFLGFVIYVWALTQFPEAGRLFPAGGAIFGRFFRFQIPLVLILATFGGAGLIASDLRTGGILVYLSRPLTRRDYVLGKLGVLLALILFVTLVPALLLYAIALGLAPSHFLKWSLAWVAPAVTLYALALALVVGLLALAVSSLSRSMRVAQFGFFGLVMGLEVFRGILGLVLARPEAVLVSPQGNLRLVGDALFGIASRGALAWPLPALVLVVLGVGCVAVLRARVRAVEIVT